MSATKFTDFFVHDILDYTILTKEDKNFVKNISIFDLKDALNELQDIVHDKIKMKNITTKINFVGMEDGEYIVQTD